MNWTLRSFGSIWIGHRGHSVWHELEKFSVWYEWETHGMPWAVVDHSCPRHCVARLKVVLPGLQSNKYLHTNSYKYFRTNIPIQISARPVQKQGGWKNWNLGKDPEVDGSPRDVHLLGQVNRLALRSTLFDCKKKVYSVPGLHLIVKDSVSKRISTWSLLSARASSSSRASILSAIFKRKPARAWNHKFTYWEYCKKALRIL